MGDNKDSKVNPLTFTGFLNESFLNDAWPRVKGVIDVALQKPFEAPVFCPMSLRTVHSKTSLYSIKMEKKTEGVEIEAYGKMEDILKVLRDYQEMRSSHFWETRYVPVDKKVDNSGCLPKLLNKNCSFESYLQKYQSECDADKKYRVPVEACALDCLLITLLEGLRKPQSFVIGKLTRKDAEDFYLSKVTELLIIAAEYLDTTNMNTEGGLIRPEKGLLKPKTVETFVSGKKKSFKSYLDKFLKETKEKESDVLLEVMWLDKLLAQLADGLLKRKKRHPRKRTKKQTTGLDMTIQNKDETTQIAFPPPEWKIDNPAAAAAVKSCLVPFVACDDIIIVCDEIKKLSIIHE